MHDAKTQRIACRLALNAILRSAAPTSAGSPNAPCGATLSARSDLSVMALPFSPSTNGAAKGWAGRPRPNVVAMAKGATICAASV
jgi:hypothetical protein